jgi:hypothetical protein
VSLLKKAVGATVPVSAELPPPDSVLQAPHSPSQVLECKMVRSQGEMKLRTLIQWSDLPANLATWEDPEKLQEKFPSTPPWGQGGSQGGGNVTTDRRALVKEPALTGGVTMAEKQSGSFVA